MKFNIKPFAIYSELEAIKDFPKDRWECAECGEHPDAMIRIEGEYFCTYTCAINYEKEMEYHRGQE